MYQYETCCVAIPTEKVDELHAMIDYAEDVTYEELAEHCEGLDEWAQGQGYELDPDEGLVLKDDWHVSYHKSHFDDRPCYYLVWSAIEFIWTTKE